MSDDAIGWTNELEPLERRLLSAFRNAAFALQHEPEDFAEAVEGDLDAVVGHAHRETVLPRFRALMTTLGLHARREIRFHVPACPCLGSDEALFLRFHLRLTAGDSGTAAELARRLVDDDAVDTLLHHASAVAAHYPRMEGVHVTPMRTGNGAVTTHHGASTRVH